MIEQNFINWLKLEAQIDVSLKEAVCVCVAEANLPLNTRKMPWNTEIKGFTEADRMIIKPDCSYFSQRHPDP